MKLRICSLVAYHVKCIDPWLTKNRRVCPICKRKVFARGERRPPRRRSSTDSMSSSDADENSPLLNSVETQPNAASSTSSPPTNYQSQEGTAVTARGPNEAHVVNMASDDEETLDEMIERVLQRQSGQPGAGGDAATIEEGGVSPYSPIGEERSSTSAWSRFVR